MTETEQLADKIRHALPRVKSGAIRVWGQWFGRPHDTIHTIIDCEAEGSCLRVTFDGDEVLTVRSPGRATVDETTFRIEDAEHVLWEWHYYGRPKTPENLYHYAFERKGDIITASTNVDWHEPALNPLSSYPAVEIL